jgi:hypothetical protein
MNEATTTTEVSKMNAVEVITEKIEERTNSHVSELEQVFDGTQDQGARGNVRATLYTGYVTDRWDADIKTAFTVYVYDSPDGEFNKLPYTQVVVNFPGGTFRPIDYRYFYESGVTEVRP